ncbi:MAG: ComEC family competence protein [Flavobacteriales bacterium]|nr:ComEC family competence protein [Flavobacteriales bacterium]
MLKKIAEIEAFRSVMLSPVLMALITLLIGVLTSFYFEVKIPIYLLILLALLQAVWGIKKVSVKRQFNYFSAVNFCVLFFFIGGYLGNQSKMINHSDYFKNIEENDEPIYQIRLVEEPVEKQASYKCLAEVQAVDSKSSKGTVLLYFEKGHKSEKLQYGDVILAKTPLQEITNKGNPKEFDYRHFMEVKGIYHQGYVKEENWLLSGSSASSSYQFIIDVRSFLERSLEQTVLKKENLAVAKALTLGQKDELDAALKQAYASSGVMHILAVSGLHVGIIMMITGFFLKPLKRLRGGNWIYLSLMLVIIWFFALLTGLSPSVFRASVMFSFVLLGLELERETSVYQSLMVSALVLILIQPFIIFEMGFQLSYLAVLSIVYWQPKLYKLFHVPTWLGDKVWQLTTVSIAAQIGTFPLGLFYFHQFPNYFLLTNLIVIPLAFIVLGALLLFISLSWWSFLAEMVAIILDVLLTFMNTVVKWTEQLPMAVSQGIFISAIELILVYLILVFFSQGFFKKRSRWFIVGMASLVILFGLRINDHWGFEGQQEVVFYNSSQGVAIDVWKGKENYFMATRDVDEQELDYTVRSYWQYRGGFQDATQAENLGGAGFYRLGEKLLFISDSTGIKELEGIPKADYVYLYNVNYIRKDLLHNWKEKAEKIVLGNGISYSCRNFVAKMLKDKVHNLKQDGAFAFSF